MLLIIDCGSPKIASIKDALGSRSSFCRIIKLALLSPEHLSAAKGVIISGSPILLTESYPKLFADKFSFLKDCKVPVLGICFGLQVMGLVFGESVFMGEEVRGETEVVFLFDDPLLKDITMSAVFMEDHTEGVGLPDDDFFLLGSSEHYEVEVMKHKKKKIYGVQFHPEVSGENGKKILQNFSDMCF